MTVHEAPLFCDRCSCELVPGKGNFYVVKIEAAADPSPPILDEDVSPEDAHTKIDALIKTSGNFSEQELMDQVYRRVTIFLCVRCYHTWIEHPTG